MKVLFMTIGQVQSLKAKSVHIDIINAIKLAGHDITVLCTREKRLGLKTERHLENEIDFLRLKIGNLTKCSVVEKGITTILIEGSFKRAIKKYFKDKEFDLVIYNTPPITFASAVKYVKKRFNAKSYLMLKDIFPQNAVDIGMMSKSGIMGLMYKLFRHKEEQLYKQSDMIGCMSQANVDYLLEHNPYINAENVEIFPNAVLDVKVVDKSKDVLDRLGIDKSKLTFIYGGNLGKPQGLDYLIDGINACQDNNNVQFVIVGSGTEKNRLYAALKDNKNCHCLDYLPQADYQELCASCDIGMLVLDKRFTIPNYPSRVLSYMENSMPIMACTDVNTDIKELLEDQANCGKWCHSDKIEDFVSLVEWFEKANNLTELGNNGRKYLIENFNTDICVDKLIRLTEKE